MSKALELAGALTKDPAYFSQTLWQQITSELRRLADIEQEHRALLVNEQNLREELEALKAAMGEPVAEIIISDDDFFDKGLADDYAFGRKTRTNGTHQLYALSNKETK